MRRAMGRAVATAAAGALQQRLDLPHRRRHVDGRPAARAVGVLAGPLGEGAVLFVMFGGGVEIWWLVDCSIEMPHARAHLPQPLVALGEQLPAAEGEVLLDHVLEHGRRPVSCVRRPWVVA